MKKNICYISASAGDWGGASRVLFTMLRMLDREAFEPIVLVPCDGPILPELRARDIAYEIWGGVHNPNGFWSYLMAIVRAVIFYKRNKIDLVHFNNAFWRPAELLAAKLCGLPVVTHYHLIHDAPGPFVKYSSAIVTVSQYTADHSEPASVPKHVVHNSVDLDKFDAAVDIRTELGFQREDVIITFVGQIRTIKGIDIFLNLTRCITEPAAKFLIVGECRDRQKYKDAWSEEYLQHEIADDPRVRYIGYREDVQNVYCASDIIVMPSRWQEPFGLINIEAGAARKPIVSARVGGVPEVIEDGVNGYLFAPDDTAALAGRVRELINDQELRRRMGKEARRIVERRFTSYPVRQLEALYRSLIG